MFTIYPVAKDQIVWKATAKPNLGTPTEMQLKERPAYFAIQRNDAEMYARNWGYTDIHKFKFIKDSKILILNVDSISKLMKVAENQPIHELLQMAYGLGVSDQKQYRLYEKYIQKYKGENYRIDVTALDNDVQMEINRASILEVDTQIKNWILELCPDIDGYFTHPSSSQYIPLTCRNSACGNTFHAELVVRNPKQTLKEVERTPEIIQHVVEEYGKQVQTQRRDDEAKYKKLVKEAEQILDKAYLDKKLNTRFPRLIGEYAWNALLNKGEDRAKVSFILITPNVDETKEQLLDILGEFSKKTGAFVCQFGNKFEKKLGIIGDRLTWSYSRINNMGDYDEDEVFTLISCLILKDTVHTSQIFPDGLLEEGLLLRTDMLRTLVTPIRHDNHYNFDNLRIDELVKKHRANWGTVVKPHISNIVDALSRVPNNTIKNARKILEGNYIYKQILVPGRNSTLNKIIETQITQHIRPRINALISKMHEQIPLFVSGGDAFCRYIPCEEGSSDIDVKCFYNNIEEKSKYESLVIENIAKGIQELSNDYETIIAELVSDDGIASLGEGLKIEKAKRYGSKECTMLYSQDECVKFPFRLRKMDNQDYLLYSIDLEVDITVNDNKHSISFAIFDCVLQKAPRGKRFNDIDKFIEFEYNGRILPVASPQYLKYDIRKTYDDSALYLGRIFVQKHGKDLTRITKLLENEERNTTVTQETMNNYNEIDTEFIRRLHEPYEMSDFTKFTVEYMTVNKPCERVRLDFNLQNNNYKARNKNLKGDSCNKPVKCKRITILQRPADSQKEQIVTRSRLKRAWGGGTRVSRSKFHLTRNRKRPLKKKLSHKI